MSARRRMRSTLRILTEPTTRYLYLQRIFSKMHGEYWARTSRIRQGWWISVGGGYAVTGLQSKSFRIMSAILNHENVYWKNMDDWSLPTGEYGWHETLTLHLGCRMIWHQMADLNHMQRSHVRHSLWQRYVMCLSHSVSGHTGTLAELLDTHADLS